LVFVVFILNGFLTVAFSHENDPLTSEEREWLKQHDGKIVLGHDPSANPIDFYDKNDVFSGLAADYVHLIEKKLNFKFKVSKNKTWNEVLEKAKRGEIDVLCAFSKSPERAEWMNFTDPYIKIPAVILVRNEIKGELKLEQMKGMKITFTKGWVIEEFLKNNYGYLNLVPSIDEKSAIENVSLGVADAAVTALTSAILSVNKFKIPNLRIASEIGLSFDLAIASRKDRPILHSILSKGLSQISQEERNEIYSKWIRLSNPSIFENKTFIYLVSGSIAGIILIVILIIVWNRILKKQVAQRTIELQKEINERKQANEALQRSKKKFSFAFNLAADPMAITKLEDGIVIDANKATLALTGYERSEFVGKSGKELKIYPDYSDRETIQKEMENNGFVNNLEIKINSVDGIKECLFSATRIEIDNEVCMLAVLKDITKLKKVENLLRDSLEEKETLLHEVHHRVKNNMQVINSLLKLQSNAIDNDQIKEILKESQSRVYAMSAVHETLHGSEKLSEIDLKAYLSKITTAIFQTYSVNSENVKLNSDIEVSLININQAYPLGLIINEIISNSLKYAFPGERAGEINVSMKKLDKEHQLTVIDNGIGIPKDFDWKNSKSLGLKLVRTLVENQLDGSIDMESNNGTKFTIKFNIET
jgi:PAS domain S-box-containing protein